MKFKRLMGATTIAVGFTATLSGAALANTDVVVDTSGPGSTQSVVINESTTISTTNTNVVHVTNENIQQSVSGDVTAAENTKIDGGGSELGSGDASNESTTSTSVAIGNPSVGGLGGTNETTAPTGGNGAPVAQATGGTGSVLGASTGGLGAGAATLPAVGALNPVDVSALRAAWQPTTEAPTTAIVKQTQGISAFMLTVAAALSLLGALGSAVYARRKEGSV